MRVRQKRSSKKKVLRRRKNKNKKSLRIFPKLRNILMNV